MRVGSDVTLEIFSHCVSYPNRLDPTKAPVLLTLVCRSWRELALGAPRLWTTLSLQCKKVPWPVVRRAFELSRKCSILLSLVKIPTTVALDSLPTTRIRELRLENVQYCQLGELNGVAFPVLVHLSIELSVSTAIDPFSGVSSLPITAFKRAPNLQHVYIEGILEGYQPKHYIDLPWVQLRTLMIEHPGFPSIKAFHKVISCCPNLTYLQFPRISPRPINQTSPRKASPKLLLSGLQRLFVKTSSGIQDIFTSFSMPSLTCIYIDVAFLDDIEELGRTLAHVSTLRTLGLAGGISYDEDFIDRILLACRSLDVLHVKGNAGATALIGLLLRTGGLQRVESLTRLCMDYNGKCFPDIALLSLLNGGLRGTGLEEEDSCFTLSLGANDALADKLLNLLEKNFTGSPDITLFYDENTLYLSRAFSFWTAVPHLHLRPVNNLSNRADSSWLPSWSPHTHPRLKWLK
ncbi:hypothetical protein D9611_014256 [Ephemerocybe angulata]|uniref:F-box domain-containing protein n=1 Tax=Ephemerocybe angulata TaxID=980116 RepID=A0A8H5BTA0_9AGAR|nr:hypothetical protein D9611_014256 [Tulosesus angulatus]